MGNNRVPVTDIEKVRKGWVLVRATEGSWLLPERAVDSAGIRPGLPVLPAEMDGLARREQLPRAGSDAQRYISAGERTMKQLRSYLERRGYHSAVVSDISGWATDTGLVNDRRYAEIFVSSHSRRSPMGNFRIRMELLERGVPSNVVEEILAGRDEEELHSVLVREIEGKYGNMEHQRAFRRASGYLRRRGFSFDLVRRVLEEALGSSGGPPD
ncbi:MAG: RecX family transcriptional regulator [Candidatus Aegiribacteria sp.]